MGVHITRLWRALEHRLVASGGCRVEVVLEVAVCDPDERDTDLEGDDAVEQHRPDGVRRCYPGLVQGGDQGACCRWTY
jgi:hypothetical protein